MRTPSDLPLIGEILIQSLVLLICSIKFNHNRVKPEALVLLSWSKEGSLQLIVVNKLTKFLPLSLTQHAWGGGGGGVQVTG